MRLDRSGWGPGGRRFKCCLPDQTKALLSLAGHPLLADRGLLAVRGRPWRGGAHARRDVPSNGRGRSSQLAAAATTCMAMSGRTVCASVAPS